MEIELIMKEIGHDPSVSLLPCDARAVFLKFGERLPQILGELAREPFSFQSILCAQIKCHQASLELNFADDFCRAIGQEAKIGAVREKIACSQESLGKILEIGISKIRTASALEIELISEIQRDVERSALDDAYRASMSIGWVVEKYPLIFFPFRLYQNDRLDILLAGAPSNN